MFEVTTSTLGALLENLCSNISVNCLFVAIQLLVVWIFKKKNAMVICLLLIGISVTAIIIFHFDCKIIEEIQIFFIGGLSTVLLLIVYFKQWGWSITAYRNAKDVFPLIKITEHGTNPPPTLQTRQLQIIKICKNNDWNDNILSLLQRQYTPKADEHIESLYNMLKPIHPGAQPLFAYIAYQSALQLKNDRGMNTGGEDISDEKYVKILMDSVDYENLEDITFISTISPEAWGDPETRNTDQAKMAWDYFAAQKRRKAQTDKPIRIRRFLLIEQKVWDSDPLAKVFLKMHREACIDLFLLPPSLLKDRLQGLASESDMALFIGNDKCSWLIWSDLNQKKLALRMFLAGIVYDKDIIYTNYSLFLQTALKGYNDSEHNGSLMLACDSSNKPSNTFLNEHNLS